jgi:flavin-dependent dehydrogenase
MTMNEVIVIGGGLAGVETAWQAACQGVRVRLYEMRPVQTTPAHPFILIDICVAYKFTLTRTARSITNRNHWQENGGCSFETF